MIFTIYKEEQELLQTIGKAAQSLGYPAYVVGGFVRDRLLGRESKDLDVVCVGSGVELAQELTKHLRPRPRLTVYKRFGTACIKHQGVEIEFVGARKESYRSDSRKPIVEQGTLTDDQNRRDFTINALAVSLNEHDFGTISDPFDGLKDLGDKIIRTPLEPGQTFSDDPLRMMRAIRFAAQLGFKIEQETLASIKQNRRRIHIVSKERITTELNKIILSPIPSVGFHLLYDTGLLKIIFPEMADLQGVDVRGGKAHKDNFYHTLEVLDNLAFRSMDLWLRWSAILHDIAKPATKRWHPRTGWSFHGHEALGATWVPKIFRRMRLPLDHKMKYVQKMVRLHQRPICLSRDEITDSAIRRLLFDAGEDIDDLMLLCESDITSKNRDKVERYLENYQLVRQKIKEVEEADHMRNWQPPISGEDIMDAFDLRPSREVGIIKDAIREAILDGVIPNEREAAWKYMLDQADRLGLKAPS